jgi:hypothetical protein
MSCQAEIKSRDIPNTAAHAGKMWAPKSIKIARKVPVNVVWMILRRKFIRNVDSDFHGQTLARSESNKSRMGRCVVAAAVMVKICTLDVTHP